jgi:hypothetical protein
MENKSFNNILVEKFLFLTSAVDRGAVQLHTLASFSQ